MAQVIDRPETPEAVIDISGYKLDIKIFPEYVEETVRSSPDGEKRPPETQKSIKWHSRGDLGEGRHGIVTKHATEGEPERCRAVKMLKKASIKTYRIMYEREILALAEFSKIKHDSKNVFLDFYGWYEDDNAIYIAMECVTLGNLSTNIESVNSNATGLPENEAKEITIQILQGLKIMHKANFVHRDLKPDNILVVKGGPDWQIKIGDFGQTKCDTEGTALRTQTGTLRYQAPEQRFLEIPNVKYDVTVYTSAVDIWAVGCIMHQLLSGKLPFLQPRDLLGYCKDPTKWQASSTKLPLSSHYPGSQFLRTLLCPDPRQRPSAAEILDRMWLGPSLDNVRSLRAALSRYEHEYNAEIHKKHARKAAHKFELQNLTAYYSQQEQDLVAKFEASEKDIRASHASDLDKVKSQMAADKEAHEKALLDSQKKKLEIESQWEEKLRCVLQEKWDMKKAFEERHKILEEELLHKCVKNCAAFEEKMRSIQAEFDKRHLESLVATETHLKHAQSEHRMAEERADVLQTECKRVRIGTELLQQQVDQWKQTAKERDRRIQELETLLTQANQVESDQRLQHVTRKLAEVEKKMENARSKYEIELTYSLKRADAAEVKCQELLRTFGTKDKGKKIQFVNQEPSKIEVESVAAPQIDHLEKEDESDEADASSIMEVRNGHTSPSSPKVDINSKISLVRSESSKTRWATYTEDEIKKIRMIKPAKRSSFFEKLRR